MANFVLDLETILGRPWSSDDLGRTMERLQRVSAGSATVEEEVNHEVMQLGGGGGLAPAAADDLASTLSKYYATLLQAWSAITEPHPPPPATLDDDNFPNLSVVVPPPGTFDDDNDDFSNEDFSNDDIDDDDFPDDLFGNEDEDDEDNDYIVVYDEDGNVSIEDTLSAHQCNMRRYDKGDNGKDDDQEADNCCICLDRLHQGLVAILDCKHEFHGDCITTWLLQGRNFCPLCKAKALTLR